MGEIGNKTQHSCHFQCCIGDTNVKGLKAEEQMVMNWPFCRRIKIPLDCLENVVQEQPSGDSLGIKNIFSNRIDVYQKN